MRIRGLLLTLCLVAARAALLNLNDDSFDDFVDNLADDTLLLVDFFKPGCRFCQKLSPVLDYLHKIWEEEEADPEKRWFKIAKVDCSKNPRLSSVFGITKFPNLKFVRAGQWSTYEGNWTIEGFQEFKDRMAVVSLPGLSAEELKDMVEVEEAVFVLVTEAGADPKSAAVGVALVANGLQHRAVFGTTTSEALSSLGMSCESLPSLVKLMAGPDGLLSLAFEESTASASYMSITRWVEAQNHPLVCEFTVDNFVRFGNLGKLMVIGLVDPKAQNTEAFKRGFNKVATGMGLKNSDKFVFGIMDGVRFSGFAESMNVYDALPRLVVYDMPRDGFYSEASTPMEPMETETFLWGVLSGDIPRQSSASDTVRLISKIWWLIQNGGAWSLLLLIPLVGFFWVCCDTPEWEERRAKAREDKRQAAETRRLKRD